VQIYKINVNSVNALTILTLIQSMRWQF